MQKKDKAKYNTLHVYYSDCSDRWAS